MDSAQKGQLEPKCVCVTLRPITSDPRLFCSRLYPFLHSNGLINNTQRAAQLRQGAQQCNQTLSASQRSQKWVSSHSHTL